MNGFRVRLLHRLFNIILTKSSSNCILYISPSHILTIGDATTRSPKLVSTYNWHGLTYTRTVIQKRLRLMTAGGWRNSCTIRIVSVRNSIAFDVQDACSTCVGCSGVNGRATLTLPAPSSLPFEIAIPA